MIKSWPAQWPLYQVSKIRGNRVVGIEYKNRRQENLA